MVGVGGQSDREIEGDKDDMDCVVYRCGGAKPRRKSDNLGAFCDGDDMVCDDNARGDRCWRVETVVYFLVQTFTSRAMAG